MYVDYRFIKIMYMDYGQVTMQLE